MLKEKIEEAIPMFDPLWNSMIDVSDTPIQINAINQVIMKKEPRVRINNGLTRAYVPSAHIQEITKRARKTGKQEAGGSGNGIICETHGVKCDVQLCPYANEGKVNYAEYSFHKGQFELIFMGIKLYSKLLTNDWPELDSLVETCKEIYNDYMNNLDIEHYEFKYTPAEKLDTRVAPSIEFLDNQKPAGNKLAPLNFNDFKQRPFSAIKSKVFSSNIRMQMNNKPR